jgi:hypothetical protein
MSQQLPIFCQAISTTANVPPLNRFGRTILSGGSLVSRTTSAPTKASAYRSPYSCFLSAKAVIKGFLFFGMFVQRTQEVSLAASWRANSVIQIFALPKETKSEYRDGPLSTSRFLDSARATRLNAQQEWSTLGALTLTNRLQQSRLPESLQADGGEVSVRRDGDQSAPGGRR